MLQKFHKSLSQAKRYKTLCERSNIFLERIVYKSISHSFISSLYIWVSFTKKKLKLLWIKWVSFSHAIYLYNQSSSYQFYSIMVGFDSKNKSPLSNAFLCLNCSLILRHPCQLDCGHRMCRTCIDSIEEWDYFYSTFLCDDDENTIFSLGVLSNVRTVPKKLRKMKWVARLFLLWTR